MHSSNTFSERVVGPARATASLLLLSLLALGCTDSSPADSDAGPLGADAGPVGEDPRDGGDGRDATVDVDGFVDIDGGSPGLDAGPRDTSLQYESLLSYELPLIPGSSFRIDVDTSEWKDVEFFVAKDFYGFVELANRENDLIVFSIDEGFGIEDAGTVGGRLPPGNYSFYAENTRDIAHEPTDVVTVELATVPTFDPAYATRVGTVFDEGRMVDGRAGSYDTFEVRAGHVYVLRGVRGRLDVYLVAADQIPLLEAGDPFLYVRSWVDANADAREPDLEVLELPPGTYALAYANQDEWIHGFALRIDEHRLR